MSYADPECYVACIEAATRIATQRLSDSEDGDEGVDKETRNAARECLRRVFNEIYAEAPEPPEDEGDDT